MKKYNGSPVACFYDIDHDHSGIISRGEFKARAVFRMSMTETEAVNTFDAIDVNRGGSISLSEFLSAISMSEPSLFLEDLRKKIRQRFRSIRQAFDDARDHPANYDLDQNPKLQFQRFEDLLKEMELKTEELRKLFDLIDANKEGQLTVEEFVQGMRHFAPSCLLDDLQFLCGDMHRDSVHEVFDGFDLLKPLSLTNFQEVLESKGLTKARGVEIELIFALLDVKHEGMVTLAKLIAALQSGGPGRNVRQTSEERDRSAHQEVKGQLYPRFKFIGELKNQVRQGLHSPDPPTSIVRQSSNDGSPGHALSEASGSPEHAGRSMESPSAGGLRSAGRARPHLKHSKDGQSMIVQMHAERRLQTPQSAKKDSSKPTTSGDANSDAGAGDDEANAAGGDQAPRIRIPPQEELAKYMAKVDPSRIQHKKIAQDPITGVPQSYNRLWHILNRRPDAALTMPKERVTVRKEILQYYQKATEVVGHDVPLLERSLSRHAAYRSAQAHASALDRS
jgi:Ca2+-binding EF-hand superfamily protein